MPKSRKNIYTFDDTDDSDFDTFSPKLVKQKEAYRNNEVHEKRRKQLQKEYQVVCINSLTIKSL
jgi:hypothetical protein